MNPFDDPWGTPPEPEPDESTLEGLLELLNSQAALLVSVATGGPRIQDINGKYQQRRRKLNVALRARGIKPPFPWDDLWAWYGAWSEKLGSYASRRIRIAELAKPAREALEAAIEGVQVADPGTSETSPGRRSTDVLRASWPSSDVDAFIAANTVTDPDL